MIWPKYQKVIFLLLFFIEHKFIYIFLLQSYAVIWEHFVKINASGLCIFHIFNGAVFTQCVILQNICSVGMFIVID
ncbi:MAG: hypothetical protein CVU97_00900 [Firmicutes bacterium HGW-Firmicutes-21]|nr:MAG: hypothetical protein CVU97_00900 [Firmicutes bacterium HGW-Firmicutes-21]